MNENKARHPEPKAGLKSRTRLLLSLITVSTKLGLTSFGGPAAHLGYFHHEYVRRQGWIDERGYAELTALCQFLPGPTSSQVGIGIGIMRGGWLGGIAAWVGFTLPSALALALFAMLTQGAALADAGWVHGLKLVAVAIVAHAVLGMAPKLAVGRSRTAIAVASLCATLLWQTAISQIAVIALAAAAGMLLYSAGDGDGIAAEAPPRVPLRRRSALIALAACVGIFALLPLLRFLVESPEIALFDSFYRSGSLVFGGGHIVLPLLERELVPAGWLDHESFLAGYSAAQAVPGPLFTFAAYAGAVADGWTGAALAVAAIFLPGFLLVAGALPFWHALRRHPKAHGAIAGVNAAVVGILIAALYDPIWTSAVHSPADFAAASALFAMLAFWKLPPWLVVIGGALTGMLFYS